MQRLLHYYILTPWSDCGNVLDSLTSLCFENMHITNLIAFIEFFLIYIFIYYFSSFLLLLLMMIDFV